MNGFAVTPTLNSSRVIPTNITIGVKFSLTKSDNSTMGYVRWVSSGWEAPMLAGLIFEEKRNERKGSGYFEHKVA